MVVLLGRDGEAEVGGVARTRARDGEGEIEDREVLAAVVEVDLQLYHQDPDIPMATIVVTTNMRCFRNYMQSTKVTT